MPAETPPKIGESEPPDENDTEAEGDQESKAILPKEGGEPPVAKNESSDDSDSDKIPLPRDKGEAPLVKQKEDAKSDEAIGEKPGEYSKVEELVPDAPPVSEEKVAPPKNVVMLPVSEEFKPDESEEVEDEEEENDENSDSKKEMKKKALKDSEGESEESDAIPPKPKSTKSAKMTSLMSSLWKLLLLIAVSSRTFPICTMKGGEDAQQYLGCLVHFYKIRFPSQYLNLSVPSPSKLSLLQDGRIMRCHKCDLAYNTLGMHSLHMKQYHEKALACEECGHRFTLPSSLVKHRLNHHASFPKNCDDCGHFCVAKDDFKRHVKVQHGEGPIHLVGSHCIDFCEYRNTGAGDEVDEKDGNTDDNADMEEAEDTEDDADMETDDPLLKEKSDVETATSEKVSKEPDEAFKRGKKGGKCFPHHKKSLPRFFRTRGADVKIKEISDRGENKENHGGICLEFAVKKFNPRFADGVPHQEGATICEVHIRKENEPASKDVDPDLKLPEMKFFVKLGKILEPITVPPEPPDDIKLYVS